jgi:hypothetical protein
MISKKHNKRTLYSFDRRLGFYLLAAGIAMFLISLLVQTVFIRGTNFKQQYRQLENKDCIQKGNSESLCNKRYPL